MGILQRLHDSEINASITIAAFYDGAWTVKIGDELNGFKAEQVVGSEADAEAWLDAKARELFPASDYARTPAAVASFEKPLLNSAAFVQALMAIAETGAPPDIQELLVRGDASTGVRPNALLNAIAAYLAAAGQTQR